MIEENWEDLFEQVGSNAAYDIFIGNIMKYYDMAFQKVFKKYQNKNIRKPWITNALHKKTMKKNLMFHAFVKSRDISMLKEYKKVKKSA